jgi:predicted metal-binding membrane protein
MSRSGARLEALLRRERGITLVGLIALAALAWAWLLAGAGTRMGSMDAMASMAVPAPWGPGAWLAALAMWQVMMVAMMTPAAAPTVLLYARVHRAALDRGETGAGLAPTSAFVAGYLVAWFGFSLLAATAQGALAGGGLISPDLLSSRSRWLSAGVLLAAGAWQLSPAQDFCLSHCRAPAAFLARHWRPGTLGAVRLGIAHGAYCVGCCWALMGLLFIGGVMNPAWIAALSALVLAEKAAPGGRWIARAAGVALIAWGAAVALGRA